MLKALKQSESKPIFLTLIGMAFLYYGFYPGVMTWDSLEQLRQARSNDYGDWQPPAMAFIWHYFLALSDSPALMLFTHMALLYGATIYFYLWAMRHSPRKSKIFLLLPFLPWVLNFEFVIWKDMGLSFAWLFSAAMAIYYSDRKNLPIPAYLVIGLLFLYGFLVRGNSPAGAIFLLPFLIACALKRNSYSNFGLSILVVVLLFAFLPKAVNWSLSARAEHPIGYAMFDDLVALKMRGVIWESKIISQEDILQLQKCEHLKNNPVGAVFCLNDKFNEIQKNNSQGLETEWRLVVTGNIRAYLLYRTETFAHLLRSPVQEPYYHREFRVISSPYHFDSDIKPSSAIADLVSGYVSLARILAAEIFKPYLWLILAVIVAGLLKKIKSQKHPFWMLPISGISYVIGYFPITPAADFRYAYWTTLVVTISWMIWIVLKSAESDKKSASSSVA